MSGFCCNCSNKCACTSIIASIIIGIVAGILRITGVITVTPAFLWVVFGIAGLSRNFACKYGTP